VAVEGYFAITIGYERPAGLDCWSHASADYTGFVLGQPAERFALLKAVLQYP
jgi:hypothetical protein